MIKKHDEALRKILIDFFYISKIAQAIEQINDLFNKKKSETVLDEGKIEKIKLINKIANQRFCWKRDSNEDAEGWLEIGKISAEILKVLAQAGINKLGKE